jgi:hypothetical protein
MLQLFFTIIAAVLVSIILLILGVLVAFKLLKWRLKRAFSEIGNVFKGMAAAANAVPPARLHLRPNDNPEWSDEEAVDCMAEPLLKLGFQDIGAYTIDEIDNTTVRAMAHRGQSMYAAVYEHPQAGVFADLVTKYQQGPSLTVSSTVEGDGLVRPEDRLIIRIPGAESQELYQRALSERSSNPLFAGKTLRPVSREEFPTHFERAYAEEMDWRLKRGWVSPDEIRAVAARGGQNVDDTILTMTALAMRAQVNERIEEVVRERFLEQVKLPLAEWERVRDRLQIVHDRMDLSDVICLVSNHTDVDEFDEDDENPAAKMPAGMTVRKYFSAANTKLPPNERYALLGSVDEPIPADVYAEPNRDEDDEED